MAEQRPASLKEYAQTDTPASEEKAGQGSHVEQALDSNLVYDNYDEEPEFHARTWIAVLAMFFLNLVQVFALQGPPAALNYIGKDLNDTQRDTWVPNALSLVQAVLAPVISSASDTFQARKTILVSSSAISFIGAAIAPGSSNIYRVIAAQVLIGFGFATVPLAYTVPSEILPRKWRPMAQSCMNIAAAIGAIVGPLIIGGLTRRNAHTGWRNFFWIQMALWGLTAICLFIGYRPPKRHTSLDHLSLIQKLRRIDLLGAFLLTTGLTLFLVGLNLGGGIYTWTAAPVLATLVVGLVVLIAFGLYEWKGTRSGILHHDLFRGGKDRGRTFALCVLLIFIEGILLFSYILFYPVMTSNLFETDPFLETARDVPFWLACGLSTVAYGYASTKLRTIRLPLFVGFLIFTAGIVGLATIELSNNASAIVFAGLAGLGFGGPLILIIAGVQLSTPHEFMATATAATACARAVGATTFTAIYSAALSTRLGSYIPDYIAAAAMKAGLPQPSVGPFIEALSGHNSTALNNIPGLTPVIIDAGSTALKQAYADGVRVVYIIAAPFGALACVVCWFLGDMKKTMNYYVDAPVENLHAKNEGHAATA
ncbi:major facilitator superfamily domain-containing protein [Talaromyces proteolyticus]|uniref:Major facilitator superfamily domain-containing protein n=1 Tax=Talaromyces proteolyticus TaxID=1131652 RepID=A0AAD4KU21_9EURO|nr:major facilitator superfamily domain-containing protein [Talaromyces proteolyticus]KAH8700873.1 major facilitator superfamily domain-containing protein [Talaromyces proteolyticus]